MTHEEAIEEADRLYNMMKNRKATDPWHKAVNGRISDLFSYVICSNCRDKDPGPWEVPPIPEGVEP